MEGFIKGDVVVVNFPFTNLREAKRRPALVIKVIDNEDLILCQITSKFNQDNHSIYLSNKDFLSGGLMKESFIRPNRIFTLHKDLILRKAVQLKPETIFGIISMITSFLEND
jgi:mRNA interferase MazF